MGRDPIDLHAVEERHQAIHARLLNWALWQRSGFRRAVLPMFQGYRDNYPESRPAVSLVVDTLDALRIQRAFSQLPEKYRHAIGWSYVKPWIHPSKVCRILAVSRAGLADLVRDGRTMVKNGARDA